MELKRGDRVRAQKETVNFIALSSLERLKRPNYAGTTKHFTGKRDAGAEFLLTDTGADSMSRLAQVKNRNYYSKGKRNC